MANASSAHQDASPGRDDGLRARKRAATIAAIERTALEMAATLGYDQVTVEKICDASMISPRTFFNYFGSKEGAVLGAVPPEPSDEERAAFIGSDGSDVLGELVTMLTATLADHDPDPAIFNLRQIIIGQRPELLLKQVDRIAEQETKIVALVLERYARRGRVPADDPELLDEARMVVALVGSVLRFTVREWTEEGSTTSAAEVLTKAVRLIHKVARGDEPGGFRPQ